MITLKNIQYVLVSLVIVSLFAITDTALADHEAIVAGVVIPLANASLGHGKNCDDVHYHGDLDGKADPDPEACGHGIVTILAHDKDDESIIPETEATEEDSGPSTWSKIKGWFIHAADVVSQALGGSSPETIYDSVDIVVEATPSLKDKKDNIEEYRDSVSEDEDTLGLYDTSTDGLEDWKLSKWFFDWVHGN